MKHSKKYWQLVGYLLLAILIYLYTQAWTRGWKWQGPVEERFMTHPE